MDYQPKECQIKPRFRLHGDWASEQYYKFDHAQYHLEPQVKFKKKWIGQEIFIEIC